MKTVNYLFLVIILALSMSCSVSKTTTVENTNTTAANSANSQSGQSLDNTQQNAATGTQNQDTPDALIKDLYKTHEKDNGTILNGKSRTLLDKYFDKNLADLIWKDLTTHKDEVGVIDFDLFYNAQDIEIKKLNVGAPKITGEKATVPVTFENYGKKQTVTYNLVQQKTAWKISDINYGEDNTLLTYFKDDAKNAAADKDVKIGNFEGNYQVGDTTATVKPIKMAFEIKWAKGSGTMTFFYVGEDAATDHKYSSEDKGKGIDSFIFDDESLTTGKFIRADGKEMAVKKVK